MVGCWSVASLKASWIFLSLFVLCRSVLLLGSEVEHPGAFLCFLRFWAFCVFCCFFFFFFLVLSAASRSVCGGLADAVLEFSPRASKMSIAECQDDSSSSSAAMSLIRIAVGSGKVIRKAQRKCCMLGVVLHEMQASGCNLSAAKLSPTGVQRRIPKKSAAPTYIRFILYRAPIGFNKLCSGFRCRTGSIYHTWFCFSSRWEGARTYLALT